jgi:hypothetical protein
MTLRSISGDNFAINSWKNYELIILKKKKTIMTVTELICFVISLFYYFTQKLMMQFRNHMTKVLMPVFVLLGGERG